MDCAMEYRYATDCLDRAISLRLAGEITQEDYAAAVREYQQRVRQIESRQEAIDCMPCTDMIRERIRQQYTTNRGNGMNRETAEADIVGSLPFLPKDDVLRLVREIESRQEAMPCVVG